MAYTIEVHLPASTQVEALPIRAAKLLIEIFAVLEIVPWSGAALNDTNPDAPDRTIPFADGMVTYLVLEDQLIVDILDVQWIDLSPDIPG